jgi:hypothetical protein
MFKKCEGPHACLLKNVSPCPATLDSDGEAMAADIQRGSSRPRSRGFVAQDELIEALGVTAPAGPANSNVRDGAAASVEDFLASRQVS